MKKTKSSLRVEHARRGRWPFGNGVVMQEGLPEEVTLSSAPRVGKELPCKGMGKNVPARGHNNCEVLVVGANLEKLEDWSEWKALRQELKLER